ncbi:DUF3134 domain-containing protein [Calothrix rhizosoleniae]|uniref:DUF3134 domain-containing protein n=1 Tax=Calothrix rhizosoleniae TaxID=888997 RepID=UPI000B4A3532|nr:DUF3134 domain-containing protein [Calothrix rhizosoleniae]
MLNSPLREAPRNQRADIIPVKQESSLLDWLKSSNRLIPRDVHEKQTSEEEEDVESMLGVEDGIGYDDDDFDDEEGDD